MAHNNTCMHTFYNTAHTAHRQCTMCRALVVAWGVRLTLNFARKGGYSLSFEDYRWEHVGDVMCHYVWHG